MEPQVGQEWEALPPYDGEDERVVILSVDGDWVLVADVHDLQTFEWSIKALLDNWRLTESSIVQSILDKYEM